MRQRRRFTLVISPPDRPARYAILPGSVPSLPRPGLLNDFRLVGNVFRLGNAIAIRAPARPRDQRDFIGAAVHADDTVEGTAETAAAALERQRHPLLTSGCITAIPARSARASDRSCVICDATKPPRRRAWVTPRHWRASIACQVPCRPPGPPAESEIDCCHRQTAEQHRDKHLTLKGPRTAEYPSGGSR